MNIEALTKLKPIEQRERNHLALVCKLCGKVATWHINESVVCGAHARSLVFRMAMLSSGGRS